MFFIKIFIGVCSAYFIFCGILSIINSIVAVKEIKDCLEHINSEKKSYSNIGFKIILPVLREQGVIENSIRFFYKYTEMFNMEIIVVTAQREKAEYAPIEKFIIDCIESNKKFKFDEKIKLVLNRKKYDYLEKNWEILSKEEKYKYFSKYKNSITSDIVDKVINNLDGKRIKHLTANLDAKGKVGQINYTYNNYLKNLDEDNYYVGIYDVDSRPDSSVFKAICNIVNKRANIDIPPLIQQVPSYFVGYEKLKGLEGLLAFADAFSQTRWALGFEYAIYKRYSKKVIGNKIRPLIYCIGHGCFVHSKTIDYIKSFPEQNPNDDLSLGYLMSVLGLEVMPLPVPDNCEIAKKSVSSINQYRFWFGGSKRYMDDINCYCKKYNISLSKIQKFWFRLQGGMRNFFWACRSMLFTLSAILSLWIYFYEGNFLPFFATMTGFLMYVIIGNIVLDIELRKINMYYKPKIKMLLGSLGVSIINFILRGIGPFIAYFSFGKNYSYKTER